MINKPRKQSMRQVFDEHSPTFARALERMRKSIGEPLNTCVDKLPPSDTHEAPKFVRGARVRAK